jgi:hypothetical protein
VSTFPLTPTHRGKQSPPPSEMDRFITRTKRTDIRTDLPTELPALGKSTVKPWKGQMSPKTPGQNKRKEPVRQQHRAQTAQR